MFEKVSQLAERAATNVSRRQFLGRFGLGAATAAALFGTLLALPAGAGRANGVVCCRYKCSKSRLCEGGFFSTCQAAGTTCPLNPGLYGCSCKLLQQQNKATCADC